MNKTRNFKKRERGILSNTHSPVNPSLTLRVVKILSINIP
jgi:hypothetical protein